MGLLDIFKKRKKSKANQKYLYTEQEIDEYVTFMEKNFGKRDIILPEFFSTDIQLDIIIIPPTKDNDFYKLITLGMGAFKMNVPDEKKEDELEYAELIMYLPADWNMNSAEDNNYWPIQIMKTIGKLPVTNHSWIGYGYTAHNDDEGSCFAENTKFNTMLLLYAYNMNHEKLELHLSSGKKINFYQMFPIYQEELDLIKKTSLEHVLGLFTEHDITPVLNIKRSNYGLENMNNNNEEGLSEKAARRTKSNAYIKEKGIACLESLPMIESRDEVVLKDINERCKRAIACLIVAQVACDINSGNDYDKSKQFFGEMLAKYHVEDALLEKERKIFDGSYSQQDVLDIAWTYEAYWAVVWSLGLVDDIKEADDVCDCEEAIMLVSECESFEEFRGQCAPRTVDEILDMADLYYRYHWACVEKRMNPEMEIGNLDPEVVCERRRGLEWLIHVETDWNDISLDT